MLWWRQSVDTGLICTGPNSNVKVFSSVRYPFPWIDPECIKQTLLHYNCIWSARLFSHTGIKGGTYHEAHVEKKATICQISSVCYLTGQSLFLHLDSFSLMQHYWAVNNKHDVVIREQRHFQLVCELQFVSHYPDVCVSWLWVLSGDGRCICAADTHIW